MLWELAFCPHKEGDSPQRDCVNRFCPNNLNNTSSNIHRQQIQLGYGNRSGIGHWVRADWARSAWGRRCYCEGWKDEAMQQEREEAGEVNLLQLLLFTTLILSRPVHGEWTVYRSSVRTSVYALCMRRKWLLMPSRSHLHPVERPPWVQYWMLHHSLSLLQCLKCSEHNITNEFTLLLLPASPASYHLTKRSKRFFTSLSVRSYG